MECGEYEHYWQGFAEWNLFDGYPESTNAPYGIAKRLLVAYADALNRERGMNVRVAIPTNLYGPHDEFGPERSHVIPALIRKFCAGDATVWGSGKATRDFLYVEDAARGLLALAEHGTSRIPEDFAGSRDYGIFNLGSGREVSIRELAETLAQIIGLEGVLEWDASKPDGQPRRLLDTSKAKAFLGWQATTPLEDGLRRTVDWYRAGAEKKQTEGVTWLKRPS
jgi:GDP-L-fucose synthase